jgi:hypothetical protein
MTLNNSTSIDSPTLGNTRAWWLLTGTLIAGVIMMSASLTAFAQSRSLSIVPADTITLTPSNPSPGEKVLAILSSAHNLSASYVVWTLNGTVLQQSNNGLKFTFEAGPAGVPQVLTATASGGASPTVSVTKKFTVNNIRMVWEANTYTPPLYLGRSLVSPEADISVFVFPTIYDAAGNVYDPSTLMYTWRTVGEPTPIEKGLGITGVSIKGDAHLRPVDISVTIEDPHQGLLAQKRIIIPLVLPQVLLYEDNKLMGTEYAQALRGTYALTTGQVLVVAEPYFMSARSRVDENLSYAWRIANVTAQNPGSIVLRPEGMGSGSAELELIVSNNTYLKQRIRGELSVLFNAQNAIDDANPNTMPL